MTPSLPFTNIQLDLCGPFKTRQKDKLYLLLYACMYSKALAIEIVENYSAKAVLTALSKHIARHNYPHTIVSDQGSQLKKCREMVFSNCHDVEFGQLSQA